MPVNSFLLDATLDYIEAHPEEWTQDQWRCGTSACFAGHATRLAGARWKAQQPNGGDFGDLGYFAVVTPDGETTHVQWYAADVLGLSWHQRRLLFSGVNTLEDLKLLVKLIKDDVDGAELEIALAEAQLTRGGE